MNFRKRLAVAVFTVWTALAPALASAQTTVIRDAETEDIIRGYSTPLLQAAGIAPGDVDFILIRDDSINAFVAGGMNIFVFTGLLRSAGSPDEVIGVIAHEIGHIAGGHIARLGAELERASIESLVAAVLGVAAAVASGRADVGAAVAVGGASTAQRGLLAHTRVQESAADQAAFRYLQATGRSAEGLVALLERLANQELVSSRFQDPYVRTHPLTRERVNTARDAVRRAGPANRASPEEVARFARMQAKLAAFIDSPNKTLADFAGDTPNERYARSIAYFRRGELDKALPLIDGLIAAAPNDPFLWELKGQMLFEGGRAKESALAYAKAVAIRPNDPAILAPAARAYVESGDRIEEAITMLRRTTLNEPRNAGAWRQLGIALGRNGEIGEASVALAESAMLAGRRDDAALQARRAQNNLPEGSSGWIRAEDILRTAAPDRK